jgi:hypothetical protein
MDHFDDDFDQDAILSRVAFDDPIDEWTLDEMGHDFDVVDVRAGSHSHDG